MTGAPPPTGAGPPPDPVSFPVTAISPSHTVPRWASTATSSPSRSFVGAAEAIIESLSDGDDHTAAFVAAVYEVNLRTDRACFIVEAHGLGDRVDYLDGPLLTPLRSWVPTARIRDSAPNGVKTSRASQVGESIQPRR